jgi:uncharacterized membrane protein YwaF
MNVVPFNAPWFGYVGFLALVGIGLHMFLRTRPMVARRWVLSGIAAANVVLYVSFTVKSIRDPGLPQVNVTQNLPFHFCNLVAIGLIFAPHVKWRWFKALLVYPGVVAGFMALVSPVDIDIGRPLFSLPALGFYGVHSFNVILGTLLATLGFYQPTWRDAFKSVGYFAILAVLIFPLDLAMRAWVDPDANYFYEFNPENAAILQLFHSWVPVPLVYTLMLAPIAIGGCCALATIYWGAERKLGHPVGQPLRRLSVT